MTEIFIHVGLQKTGTTALQELVFKKLDVNYIRYLDRELYQGIMETDRPTLISNEDLCGFPGQLDRYQIALNLKQLFPKASIIVGLREPKSWMRSLYREAVRQGSVLSYYDWSFFLYHYWTDFHGYVQFLNKNFRSVYVYQYEDLLKDFDGEVKNLCHYLGVDYPQYENRMLNESIKSWQIPGFRLMNMVAPRMFKFSYKILRRDLQQ